MGLTDRAKNPIDEYIDRRSAKYDYAGVFAYTVVTQNGDGTLSLQPEDPDLSPPLSGVEILSDNPATRITVKKGAQCRVHFVNRNPKRPEAFGFKKGDYTLLEFGTNTFNMARQGDLVNVGGFGIIITLGAPGTIAPALCGVQLPAVIGTVTNPIGGWPGYILTGSSKNKSG
jgi:hypothetical protein